MAKYGGAVANGSYSFPIVWQESDTRFEMWANYLNHIEARVVAEIGVFRGDFAEHILDECPGISRYYMIDPWRQLPEWNKPLNVADDVFDGWYQESLERTERHEGRRVVLRGTTAEVIDGIGDESLDFAYVDGDHTLRGITIDLHLVYPKIRADGSIGGDDFFPSIWQHGRGYEPTLVFPYAVHFAEAVDAPIAVLPHDQFLIEKRPGFRFDGAQTGLLAQVRPPSVSRIAAFSARLRRRLRS